ncbi:MAG: FecR domain-containing protein [Oscillospiraceae bacterium]|nr:FecR domain-containing protein [Oscillospiraceae bacterium]
MKRVKRTLALVLAMLMLLGVMSAAAAESATATTLRLAGSSGTVSIANASGKAQTVKTDMRLYSGYTLSTGKASSAYISLDGTKAVKLDESSKSSVRKSGNKLEVFLDDGKLFFNVTAPLAADESLNIRTSTMVTGIRGSYGWVTRTEVVLIHGHVTVTCINPVTGETRVTELFSGEKVYYDPSSTAQSDPKLKEIDFIKEVITNDDFPSFVIDEMRKDVSLQTPVIEDVPTVDVPKLLEDYEQIKAAEDAATEEREQEIEQALEEQADKIAKDTVDYLFDEAGVPTYTVTLPVVNGMVFTPVGPTTGIEEGSTFSFNVAPAAGYALHEDYLVLAAGASPVTVTAAGAGSFDASFTVDSDVTVEASGAFRQVSTLVDAETAFTDETYVELSEGDVLGGTPGYVIDAGKTLLVSAALGNLPDYVNNGRIIIANTGSVYTAVASGFDNGATGTIDILGTLTVNGILNNYGTITNKANMSVAAGATFNNYSGNTVINEAGATLTVSGTFNNGDGTTNDGRLVNEGTVDVPAGGTFANSGNGSVENSGGFTVANDFTNNGTFENAGGGTLTATGGYFTNQVGAELTNDGTANFGNTNNSGILTNNDTMSVTGMLNNLAGAELTNTGYLTNTYTATNSGTWTNTGSCNLYSFENNAGGTFDTTGGEFITTNGFYDKGGEITATEISLYCGDAHAEGENNSDIVAVMNYETKTLTIRLTKTGGTTTIRGSSTDSIFKGFNAATTVVIEEGVTGMAYNLFNGFADLASCSLPMSLTSISANTFTDTVSLTEINYAGTMSGWNAINGSWGSTYPSAATVGISGKTIICSDGTIAIP